MYKNFIPSESTDASPEVNLSEGYVSGWNRSGETVYVYSWRSEDGTYYFDWETLTREEVLSDLDDLDNDSKASLLRFVGVESMAEYRESPTQHIISEMHQWFGYYFENMRRGYSITGILEACGINESKEVFT